MPSQLLIDLGAVVTLIVGFIVVIKAIRSAINTALIPMQERIINLTSTISELDELVLKQSEHKLICGATRASIKALEKTLCTKIQLLIDVVGIRGKSSGSQRAEDKK